MLKKQNIALIQVMLHIIMLELTVYEKDDQDCH